MLPYPPGKPIEEVKREFGLEEVIKLASNENPLGPSPKALRAMAAVAGEMQLYPDGAGYYLKAALADMIGITPEEIMLGNGSDEITVFLAQCYLNRKAGVITSDYSFVRYRNAAELMNAPLTLVPMKNFRHDLKAMLAAVTPTTRMVLLDLPGNPTGTIVTLAELKRFLKALPEHVIPVLDQAYYEYAIVDEDFPDGFDLRTLHPNLVVTRTFSKAYGLAGLRVGYAVAPAWLVHDVERVRPPFNTSRMAQAAALAALDDHQHLRRSVISNLKGLAQLNAGLGKLGLKPVPSHANFVLVDLAPRAAGRSGGQIFNELLKLGVVVRPMGGYGLSSFIRISVGTAAENRKCLAALRQVLASA
jgi:histidinol-phosphate aminotransferase